VEAALGKDRSPVEAIVLGSYWLPHTKYLLRRVQPGNLLAFVSPYQVAKEETAGVPQVLLTRHAAVDEYLSVIHRAGATKVLVRPHGERDELLLPIFHDVSRIFGEATSHGRDFCKVCTDRIAFHDFCNDAGLPVPPAVKVDSGWLDDLEWIGRQLGPGPWMHKRRCAEAGKGCSVVSTTDTHGASPTDSGIVEKKVKGREYGIEFYSTARTHVIYPPICSGEVGSTRDPQDRLRWAPAQLPPPLLKVLASLLDAADELGAMGPWQVDAVSDGSTAYLLEVNARLGGLADAIRATGAPDPHEVALRSELGLSALGPRGRSDTGIALQHPVPAGSYPCGRCQSLGRITVHRFASRGTGWRWTWSLPAGTQVGQKGGVGEENCPHLTRPLQNGLSHAIRGQRWWACKLGGTSHESAGVWCWPRSSGRFGAS
jgi:hypothetical protein